MNPRFSSVALRSCLGLLLLAMLVGCSIYRKVFPPYRLPTPKPSPEFKAQLEARKKGKSKTGALSFFKKKKPEENPDEEKIDKAKPAAVPPTEEAVTDAAAPAGGAPKVPGAAVPEARTLPERSTVRYDKNGIMKKPRLMRRRVHPPRESFHPWQYVQNFFKFRTHARPDYSPDHKPVAESGTWQPGGDSTAAARAPVAKSLPASEPPLAGATPAGAGVPGTLPLGGFKPRVYPKPRLGLGPDSTAKPKVYLKPRLGLGLDSAAKAKTYPKARLGGGLDSATRSRVQLRRKPVVAPDTAHRRTYRKPRVYTKVRVESDSAVMRRRYPKSRPLVQPDTATRRRIYPKTRAYAKPRPVAAPDTARRRTYPNRYVKPRPVAAPDTTKRRWAYPKQRVYPKPRPTTAPDTATRSRLRPAANGQTVPKPRVAPKPNVKPKP